MSEPSSRYRTLLHCRDSNRECGPVTLGATHTIDYKSSDIAEQAKAHNDGVGVDYVLDCVGSESAAALYGALRWEGQMACVAGPLPKEPGDARGLIAGISVHEIALVMSAFIDGQADLLRSIGTDFMALVSTGQVTPRIKRTIPLSDAVAALNAREGGSGGKTVLAF